MKKSTKILASSILGASLLGLSSFAHATLFTSTNPDGLDVTTVGASTVGGIVVTLEGSNGATVVSQLAASGLYKGYANSNPFEIGTQTGFDNSITDGLGGGLTSASIRFTLWDGDSASGNFDQGADNTLLVNGIDFGYWSSVEAENTDGLGSSGAYGFSGGGFRNNVLDTGWFTSSDSSVLSDLYNSLLTTEELVFGLIDVDPYDNYFDFTQGIDNSLIDVGQGPVVTPPPPPGGAVPEPASMFLFGAGLLGLVSVKSRKNKA